MSSPHEELIMQVNEEALTPLGSSEATAIVCCVLYVLFMCLAVYSYICTKYAWYDVIIISTAFRAVSMACRAAYIANYNPGRQGTFLAFANAGFSASGAGMWLTCGAWFVHNGHTIFSQKGDKIARVVSYLATIPILAFGPLLGVIAAGLIFGAWRTHPHAAAIGIRCRSAATWGILGMFILLFLWVLLLFLRVLKVGRAGEGIKTLHKFHGKRKNPYLIGLFLPVIVLLLIRGCAGVVALYQSKEFVWADDTWFYCLDTLPELLSLVILCWPKLFARISCAYPPEPDSEGKGDKGDTKA